MEELTPPQPNISNSEHRETRTFFTRKKALLMVGGVVLLLVVGGSVWWFLFKQDDNDADEQCLDCDLVQHEEILATDQQNDQEMFVQEEVGKQDPDGDGLSTNLEQQIGTDPMQADTDGDTILDGEEIYGWGTNALMSDTDRDGLNDYDEIKVYQTNPFRHDSDGDGYDDKTELGNGYDPTM